MKTKTQAYADFMESVNIRYEILEDQAHYGAVDYGCADKFKANVYFVKQLAKHDVKFFAGKYYFEMAVDGNEINFALISEIDNFDKKEINTLAHIYKAISDYVNTEIIYFKGGSDQFKNHIISRFDGSNTLIPLNVLVSVYTSRLG